MVKRFCVLVVVCFSCAPAAASAAPFYTLPTGTGTNCTQVDPCSLGQAINDATGGDEVIVLPGNSNYNVGAGTQIINEALNVHGPETGPVPTVTMTATPGAPVFNVDNAGAELRNMRLESTTGSGIYMRQGYFDRLYVKASTASNAIACIPFTSTTITVTSTVCWAPDGGGRGIGYVGPGGFTANFINVTAVGNDSGVDFLVTGPNGTFITATNFIAFTEDESLGNDIELQADSGGIGFTLGNSNWDSQTLVANVSFGNAGGNQTALPLFADLAGGDFKQTQMSPTVDAGIDNGTNGPNDVDGDNRLQGFRMDIGADEYNDVAPTAVDDAKTVAHDSAATTIDVLANDTDTDGGPKQIDHTSTPAHGTVAPTLDDLTYQPTAGFCGTDTFTYTLVQGGSTATVTVTVTCPVKPPDTTAPDTKLKRHPRARTRSRKATFRFTSTEAASTFMCKLDKKPFRPCTSPRAYNVRPGRHTFKVKAKDSAGNVDATPAVFRWRALRPRR